MKKISWGIVIILVSLPLVVFAHSGRTDKNGGHYNRKTGEYHYHNSGYSSNTSSASQQSNYSDETYRIQVRLIELGYNPGPADGIRGTKTIEAIKQFQRDNNITADGVVGQRTRSALKI